MFCFAPRSQPRFSGDLHSLAQNPSAFSSLRCPTSAGLSEQLLAVLAVRVLRALLHLHSVGIAHGDLKLENIVYDEVDSCGAREFTAASSATSSSLPTMPKALATAPKVALIDFGFSRNVRPCDANGSWRALCKLQAVRLPSAESEDRAVETSRAEHATSASSASGSSSSSSNSSKGRSHRRTPVSGAGSNTSSESSERKPSEAPPPIAGRKRSRAELGPDPSDGDSGAPPAPERLQLN